MKCIVTGGAGFIGSHLCLALLEADHEVICLDNFITGDLRNLEKLQTKHQKQFQLLNHDITLPLPQNFLEQIKQIDQIYHLACPASPVDYQEIPLQTLWVSAAGTKNMLELANKFGAAFLLGSTSEVYGDPLEHPQKETYWGNVNPIGVRSCYNEGKRFAESLAINYYKHYQFPLVIARIFNVYGPQMRKDDGRVIPAFINAALSSEPIRIFGNGEQSRSFCYIDDMVDGLILAMNHQKFLGPVNLGYPEEITVKDLALLIKELTQSDSIITYSDLPQDDPGRRQPDITLARTNYGFEPKVNIREGLSKTIEYFIKLA